MSQPDPKNDKQDDKKPSKAEEIALLREKRRQNKAGNASPQAKELLDKFWADKIELLNNDEPARNNRFRPPPRPNHDFANAMMTTGLVALAAFVALDPLDIFRHETAALTDAEAVAKIVVAMAVENVKNLLPL